MRVVFGGRVVISRIPKIEVLQDLFNCRACLENRNLSHLPTAIGTAERIDFVYLLNQPRPAAAELFRRRFSGRGRRYYVVGSRLFAHASGLVGICPRVSGEPLVFVRNMNDEPGEPVESVEGLFGLLSPLMYRRPLPSSRAICRRVCRACAPGRSRLGRCTWLGFRMRFRLRAESLRRYGRGTLCDAMKA